MTVDTTRHIQLALIGVLYVIGLTSSAWLDGRIAVVVVSNVVFVLYLSLSLATLDQLTETRLRISARKSDLPVFVIFSVALGIVATAIVALFLLINADRQTPTPWLLLALVSVPLGWATIHMMAAFHYAHLYWRIGADGQPMRGLEFPEDQDPDGWDFVYFSFVLGMAAQTSDVAISSRPVRRFALLHSIVAYFFNAVLVAAAVNLAASA